MEENLNITDVKSESLNENLERYKSLDLNARIDKFAKYLMKRIKSANHYKNYALRPEVSNIVKEIAGVECVYYVIDVAQLEIIYKKVKELEINKKHNNAYSAAIINYKRFIIHLISGSKQEAQNIDMQVVLSPHLPHLTALRTKPFMLLAGISGTGKSRIVRKLAQASTTAALEGLPVEGFDELRFKIHSPANFQIIQVKPNWHNSMDVVGYQTNIPHPRYVFTPFVEFIAKAWLHPGVPFFLCLDEMNLAPVEEYFAEFLSAIESRAKTDDGSYCTDPIIKPFDEFGTDVCKQMCNDLFAGMGVGDAASEPLLSVLQRFKTKGLSLPENLMVVGTVNMDETTFSFSRKVLDRAMSFEMNEVDFEAFLLGESDVVSSPLSADEVTLLVDRPVDAAQVISSIEADVVVYYLKALNKVLDGSPFKLGYRAANEAMLYVAAARDFGQDDVRAALDEFTLMKVLSRIEGDTSKLTVDGDKTILSLLRNVVELHLKPSATLANPDGSDAEAEPDTETEPAPLLPLKSIAKIDRMIVQLQRNSFVSFWE